MCCFIVSRICVSLTNDLISFGQAAEGARIAGASRIIGVDLNASRFEQGNINFSLYIILKFLSKTTNSSILLVFYS